VDIELEGLDIEMDEPGCRILEKEIRVCIHELWVVDEKLQVECFEVLRGLLQQPPSHLVSFSLNQVTY
jgi:hypothetical protein